MLFDSPVTVIGLDVPVAVMLPGIEVTVYKVIGPLPTDAGGLKLTVACEVPANAVTEVGAPGAENVTMFDIESPAALKATTAITICRGWSCYSVSICCCIGKSIADGRKSACCTGGTLDTETNLICRIA